MPGKHAALLPPFCPVNPKLHVQDVGNTDAVGELEFPEQLEHGKEPLIILNVPAAQATHVDPSAPVYPALQMQSTSFPLPASEFDAGSGQDKHVEITAAAATVEYVPPTHCTHVVGVGPRPILYVPAMHCVQVPPFEPVDPALH